MSRCTCVQGQKFCTCQPGLPADYAVKLNSPGVRALADRISVAVAGDKQIGGFSHISAGMFGHRMTTLIVELADREAELYAAQDQVAGLQELMSAQLMPAHLDHAVRVLVAAANADAVDDELLPEGSPVHGHTVRGRWDGDSLHQKGELCEECAAWDALRHYAGQDIELPKAPDADSPEQALTLLDFALSFALCNMDHAGTRRDVKKGLAHLAGYHALKARQQVDAPASREVELHAALVKAQKVIDMLFPGVSKIFGVDFQELNESCAAVSAALKAKPTDVMKAEAALASPSIELHAVPVDLIIALYALPQNAHSPNAAVKALGIKWTSWEAQEIADQILLKGCTDVPLVLPHWIEVRK